MFALLLAVLSRRPELVGVAAPALLLLAAGLPRQARPARVNVAVRPGATRLFEGEPGWVDVGLAAPEGAPAELAGFDARWAFQPGKGIEPTSATAASAATARFEFTVPRWGKRQAGLAELQLHDRWRLTEGRAVVPLPLLDV